MTVSNSLYANADNLGIAEAMSAETLEVIDSSATTCTIDITIIKQELFGNVMVGSSGSRDRPSSEEKVAEKAPFQRKIMVCLPTDALYAFQTNEPCRSAMTTRVYAFKRPLTANVAKTALVADTLVPRNGRKMHRRSSLPAILFQSFFQKPEGLVLAVRR